MYSKNKIVPYNPRYMLNHKLLLLYLKYYYRLLGFGLFQAIIISGTGSGYVTWVRIILGAK